MCSSDLFPSHDMVCFNNRKKHAKPRNTSAKPLYSRTKRRHIRHRYRCKRTNASNNRTVIRIIQTRTPCICSTSASIQQLVAQQPYKNPQFGLCLKTYNSDLYQNWINTEWIEGVDGINEASAVDVADGMLTMDALNLAQKVYNFLNRIAVSGGTYRDWLETGIVTGKQIGRAHV